MATGNTPEESVDETDILREAGVLGEEVDEDEILQEAAAASPVEPSPAAPAPPPVEPRPDSYPAQTPPEPSMMTRFIRWVDQNADKRIANAIGESTGLSPDIIAARTRGVLDFLSAGHADEAVGWLESKVPPRLSLPIADVFNEDVPTPPPRTYQQARDAQRDAMAQTAAARPLDYYGAGLGASIMAPGPRLGEGVTGAVKTGALMGGLGGAGASDADLLKGEYAKYLDDIAGGAKFGAGTGALMQRAGEVVPDAVGKFTAHLREKYAPRMAMRAMGGNSTDFTYLTDKEGLDKVDKFGRELLNAEMVRPLSSLEETFNRLQPARREAGIAIGDDLATTDAYGVPFNLEAALRRAEEEIVNPNSKSPGVSGAIGALKGKIDEFRQFYPEGTTDFVNANRLKTDMAEGQMNWGNYWNHIGPDKYLERLKKQFVGVLNSDIENQMEDVAGKAIRESFEANKDRFAALKWAERVTGRGLGREAGNDLVGLKDLQAANAAAAVMKDQPTTVSGLVAAAAAPAFRFVQRRSASVAAPTADAIGSSDVLRRIATSNPEALGEYGRRLTEAAARGGDGAVALEDYMLAQTVPEYAELRRRAMLEATGQNPSP